MLMKAVILTTTHNIFLSQKVDVSFLVPVSSIPELGNCDWVLGISIDSSLDCKEVSSQTCSEEIRFWSPPVS